MIIEIDDKYLEELQYLKSIASHKDATYEDIISHIIMTFAEVKKRHEEGESVTFLSPNEYLLGLYYPSRQYH